MANETDNYGPTGALAKALEAAVHALRSYQFHNGSTELAASVADYGDAALASLKQDTPQERFARWLEAGPRLAKAANCYVGITVTDTPPKSGSK